MCRFNTLTVDICNAVYHLDEHLAPTAAPNVAQHAFGSEKQVSLLWQFRPQHDFLQQRGVHGCMVLYKTTAAHNIGRIRHREEADGTMNNLDRVLARGQTRRAHRKYLGRPSSRPIRPTSTRPTAGPARWPTTSRPWIRARRNRHGDRHEHAREENERSQHCCRAAEADYTAHGSAGLTLASSVSGADTTVAFTVTPAASATSHSGPPPHRRFHVGQCGADVLVTTAAQRGIEISRQRPCRAWRQVWCRMSPGPGARAFSAVRAETRAG